MRPGTVADARFHFAFEWSRPEYARVIADLLRHRRRTGLVRALRAVVWVLAGLAVVLVALIVLGGGTASLVDMAPLIVLVLALLALVKWGMPWLYAVQYPAKARGTLEFWATDAELGQSSPLASAKSAWHSLDRVVETRDVLLFYITPTAAFFLPKRLLDEPELARLRAFAAERAELVVPARRRGGAS